MKHDVSEHTVVQAQQLEALLRRDDIWRGHSREQAAVRPSVDTGYPALNDELLHRGWPCGALIEVCQPALTGYGEWQLLGPALNQVESGYLVLLNPPALPFAQQMIQKDLPLDRLLVVQTQDRSDFLTSYVELARTPACGILLAWQPKQTLSYTHLRKCLLASADNGRLSVLFRHSQSREQSSPAGLRLSNQLSEHHLHVAIFKQKGVLRPNERTIALPLPTLAGGLTGFEPAEDSGKNRAQVISLHDKP